jgi:hypothetical protein
MKKDINKEEEIRFILSDGHNPRMNLVTCSSDSMSLIGAKLFNSEEAALNYAKKNNIRFDEVLKVKVTIEVQ